MNKMLACMTAAALCVSMAACTPKEDTAIPGEAEPSGATMSVQLSHSYKSQRIDLDWGCLQKIGDRLLMVRHDEEDAAFLMFWSPDTGETSQELQTKGSIWGASLVGDQIEVFRQEWSEEEKIYHTFLMVCDSELNLISETEVGDLWKEAEEPTPLWGIDTLIARVWLKDEQGNEYVGTNDGLWIKTPDDVLHQVQGVGGCTELFFDKAGRLYSVYYEQTIKLVDARNYTAENVSLPNLPKQNWNCGGYGPGNSTYDFIYKDEYFIYGARLDEGSAEELMNLEDSDFSSSVNCPVLFDDGRMLVTDYNVGRLGVYLAQARTQEEADAIQTISMVTPFTTGYGNDDYLTDIAHVFNREHDGYRITIRSYDPDNDGKGLERMEADLLDGIVPDIIVGDPSGFGNYASFSDKGLFEDLRPWMENDPDFNKDDYMFNFFEAMSYKGRIEMIDFQFYVNTWLAKTEHLNGKERLTMDDLMQLPEDMELISISKRNITNLGLFDAISEAYVDYEAGTCAFDSPEFIQVLEVLGTLPETAPVEDEDAYKNDKILFDRTYSLNAWEYHNAAQTFGTEDVTITGIPLLGDKGNGGMFQAPCPIMVSAQSQYKELIWEYIKLCLNEENQRTVYGSMPVHLTTLEEKLRADCDAEPSTGSHNGVEHISYPPTQEDVDKVLDYYKGIAYAENSNSFIDSIVREEVGMFFSGDCTAQEAAERIQGRVSIYLAEKN